MCRRIGARICLPVTALASGRLSAFAVHPGEWLRHEIVDRMAWA